MIPTVLRFTAFAELATLFLFVTLSKSNVLSKTDQDGEANCRVALPDKPDSGTRR